MCVCHMCTKVPTYLVTLVGQHNYTASMAAGQKAGIMAKKDATLLLSISSLNATADHKNCFTIRLIIK